MPPNQPEESSLENNEEINKALKEFEAANGGMQEEEHPHHIQAMITPQVSKPVDINDTDSVKFEVPNYKSSELNNIDNDTSKMAKFIIKFSGGLIKNQKQAEWILLGFAIVAIVISVYLLLGTQKPSLNDTPKMILKMNNSQLP